MFHRFIVGRGIEICGRREHDGFRVRRPPGLKIIARTFPAGAAEAIRFDQPRAGQKVAGGRRAIRRNDEQMRPRVVEPFVPTTHGKTLVRANLGFRFFAVVGDFLICRVIGRAAINRALEENRLSIRTPLRGARAQGDLGQTARLATGAVDQINLVGLVAVAFGAEGDLATVGTPRRCDLSDAALALAADFGPPAQFGWRGCCSANFAASDS